MSNIIEYILHGGTGVAAVVKVPKGAPSEYYPVVEAAFRRQAKVSEKAAPYLSFTHFDEVSPASVRFRWWLASRDGAGFELLFDPAVTKEQISNTKHWLRSNRDVVQMQVLKIDRYIEMELPPCNTPES